MVESKLIEYLAINIDMKSISRKKHEQKNPTFPKTFEPKTYPTQGNILNMVDQYSLSEGKNQNMGDQYSLSEGNIQNMGDQYSLPEGNM